MLMKSVKACREHIDGVELAEATCQVVEELAAQFEVRKDLVSYVLLLRLGRSGRTEVDHNDLAEAWYGLQETLDKAVRETKPRTFASIASNPLYFD